jgi:hypothetical protein
MKVIWGVAASAAGFFMLGCATAPEKVEASYVSPVLYRNLSCDELGLEATRVSDRATSITGQQKGQRTTDTVVTTAGVLVFWPALFFIGGDDATTAELARLKGEMKAVQDAAMAKKCPIEFRQT